MSTTHIHVNFQKAGTYACMPPTTYTKRERGRECACCLCECVCVCVCVFVCVCVCACVWVPFSVHLLVLQRQDFMYKTVLQIDWPSLFPLLLKYSSSTSFCSWKKVQNTPTMSQPSLQSTLHIKKPATCARMICWPSPPLFLLTLVHSQRKGRQQ